MRSTTVTAIAAGSLLALGACGQSDVPDDFGHTGTGINFNMGALTYPGAADVCYSFTVVNGLDQLVVGRGLASTVASSTRNPAYATWGTNTPYVQNASYTNGTPLICSTQFGNGPGGDWSYVAPCDASEDARAHTVTVWLDLFLAGTAAEELTANVDYQDPCPAGCSVDVTCQENADTPVSFNFTIMRRANQGFFDIGVNFDDVFCSAKLDSCHVDDDDNVTPIGLLFDGDGRNHTAVAAVACSAGPEAGIDTTLFMSNFVVTCPDADGNAGGTYTLDLSTVDQEGRLTLTDPGNGNALEASVFFGEEALPGVNKVFTNIAFLLPDTGEPCFVNWTVVPTEGEPPPDPANAGPGTYTHVAAVIFGPPEGSDDPGAAVQYAFCHNYTLNGGAYSLQLPLSAMNFYGLAIPSAVFTKYDLPSSPPTSCIQASQSELIFEAVSCGVPALPIVFTLDAPTLNPYLGGGDYEFLHAFNLTGTTSLAAGTVINVQMLTPFPFNPDGTPLAMIDEDVVVVAGVGGVNTFSLGNPIFTMPGPDGLRETYAFSFGPGSYPVVVTGPEGTVLTNTTVMPSLFNGMSFEQTWEPGAPGPTVLAVFNGITTLPLGTEMVISEPESIGPANVTAVVVDSAGRAPPGYNFFEARVDLGSEGPLGGVYSSTATYGSISRQGWPMTLGGATITSAELLCPEPNSGLFCDFRVVGTKIGGSQLRVTVSCASQSCENAAMWTGQVAFMEFPTPYDSGPFEKTQPSVAYPGTVGNLVPTGWPSGDYLVTVTEYGPECPPAEGSSCAYRVVPESFTFTVP